MMPSFEAYLAELDTSALYERMASRFYNPTTQRYRHYEGIDGMTWHAFMADSTQLIQAVLNQFQPLTRTGKPRFQFSPFEQFAIPKQPGSNEKRLICKPTLRNVVAQQMLLDYMNPVLEQRFLPSSYAYRPGRSFKRATKAVFSAIRHGHQWVMPLDIYQFFDHIDHDVLLGQLKRVFGEQPTLTTLCYRYLKTGTVDTSHKQKQPTGRLRSPKAGYQPRLIGLPQGGLLSTILSNLNLHDLDVMMAQEWPSLGYVRYADNLIITAKTQQELGACFEHLLDWLPEHLKLRLHHSESASPWVDLSEGVDCLGYRLTKTHIKLSPANLKRFKHFLKGVIHHWGHTNQDAPALISKLNQLIGGNHRNHEHAYRWIDYATGVTHHGQLLELDHWLRRHSARAITRKTKIYHNPAALENLGYIPVMDWINTQSTKSSLASNRKMFGFNPETSVTDCK